MSKAILEKKLYLVWYIILINNILAYDNSVVNVSLQAKESPEPIFDLSDCSLKQVPNGIFAVIKVYRKEFLYLQVRSNDT